MRSAIALLLMPVARWVPWWFLRLLESREMRQERREWKRFERG